jgi:DNA-binding MarR family transcriptional regulator
MPATLPLSTVLSFALVAFTIEFDNEFERRMPHRTTRGGSAGAPRGSPWLTSMAMWSNLMQYVPDAGVTVGDLHGLARTNLSLRGMERWRYIEVRPDPADSRARPPHRDWVVRPTAAGRRAAEVWRPLAGVIEGRWRERFGTADVDSLRETLASLVERLELDRSLDLPAYLPVLGYGLSAEVYPIDEKTERPRAVPPAARELPELLSQVLRALTIEFEREAPLSLAITANVVRVVGTDGIAVRDIPRAAGVSKESVNVALSFLQKRCFATVEPDPALTRTRIARLTPKGHRAQEAGQRLLRAIEERWEARFGERDVRAVREPLERLGGDGRASTSPLFAGLEPPAEGWRATVRRPELLPHHPMVLHRGGYPDGS